MNSKARRAGKRTKAAIREERRIAARDANYAAVARRQAELDQMRTPKRGRTTFKATVHGFCPRCGLEITVGDVCHWTADGQVVHDKHVSKDEAYTICSRCFLAKPCDCD